MQQQATAWVIGHVATAVETMGEGTTQRTKFRVLINHRYFDRTSQTWREREATGTEVVCWADLARNVAGSVHIGDPVIVHGRLEENRWVDKEGKNRKSVELIAEMVAHDLNRGTSRFVKQVRATPERRQEPVDRSASEFDPDGVLDPRSEPVPAGAPF